MVSVVILVFQLITHEHIHALAHHIVGAVEVYHNVGNYVFLF